MSRFQKFAAGAAKKKDLCGFNSLTLARPRVHFFAPLRLQHSCQVTQVPRTISRSWHTATHCHKTTPHVMGLSIVCVALVAIFSVQYSFQVLYCAAFVASACFTCSAQRLVAIKCDECDTSMCKYCWILSITTSAAYKVSSQVLYFSRQTLLSTCQITHVHCHFVELVKSRQGWAPALVN